MKPQPRRVVVALALSVTLVGSTASAATAALPGASSALTRAPYLSDLTSTSVEVSWANTTQSRGVVRYGPPGNCTANAVTAGSAG